MQTYNTYSTMKCSTVAASSSIHSGQSISSNISAYPNCMYVSLADYIELINQDTPDPTTAMPPHLNDSNHKEKEEEEELFSCDHRISLYILNQKYFVDNMGIPRSVHEDEEGDCHPPFWVSHVAKTNLLLVVVEKGDWSFKESCPLPPTTKPEWTEASTTSREPCHKLPLGALPRRRLEGCFTYHDKVIFFSIMQYRC